MKHGSFVIVVLLCMVCACSSIDCPVENMVRMHYVLKKPNATADTLKDTLTIISFKADRTDTTLLNLASQISSFSLHTGYTTPEDTLYFLFRRNAAYVVDTVWVKKDNYPHFESVDCYAAYFHTITSVRSSNNIIDSIHINNPSVNYEPEAEHLFLYLKSRR